MALECVNLTKRYGRREVVKGVSITLREGEVVGLLGPNGAGKTTTFYMLVGLERADSGQILIGGVDVRSMPVHARSAFGLGYLPQESSIFRRMTVRQNIEAVLEIRGVPGPERKRVVGGLLEEFGLEGVASQMGYSLSGGERRRVEIARALAASPTLLLLDEPFTGIDPIAVADIQDMVAKLREKGIGILITDHNVRETLSIVDRAYIMHSGEILVSGQASEIADNPIARRFYLGDRFEL
jgi:lipopolysaccharide export system ATP-binding protein